MTPTAHHKDDWKLLLTIGGLVLTGAAAIVVLSGLGSDRDPGSSNPREVARREAAVPASRTVALPALETATKVEPGADRIPGSMVGPEIDEMLAVTDEETRAVSCSDDPDADPARLGWKAWGAGDHPRAAACWDAETVRNPESAYGHYMLGLSLWKAGRFDEAADALGRSGELNPESIKTFVNLSRVFNDAGRFEAALEAAETARMIDPQDSRALYLQARSLRNLDRAEDAVVALEEALAFDTEYADARNLLGLILIHQGKADEAAEQLALAARYDPETAYVHGNLGRALEMAGRFDGAAESFRAALALDPQQATARAGLARVEPLVPEVGSEEVVVTAESDPDESAVAMTRDDEALQ